MRVLTVATQKGGVGKTTTVVSLGGLLSQQGYRTLLLDMDPHGSMTSYFKLDPDTIDNSLYRLFSAAKSGQPLDPQDIVQRTEFDKLFLMPASTAMATLDRQLGSSGGMGLIVSRALKLMEADYDFVLIDCPPLLGVLMINALAACEHLIIPVQTEFLALKGLERTLRTLEMIRRARYPVSDYTILPTMFDRRTRASLTTLRNLRERYPNMVWRSVIPVDTMFRDVSKQGVPLTIKRPRDRGAVAYAEFLADLLNATSHARSSAATG